MQHLLLIVKNLYGHFSAEYPAIRCLSPIFFKQEMNTYGMR